MIVHRVAYCIKYSKLRSFLPKTLLSFQDGCPRFDFPWVYPRSCVRKADLPVKHGRSIEQENSTDLIRSPRCRPRQQNHPTPHRTRPKGYGWS